MIYTARIEGWIPWRLNDLMKVHWRVAHRRKQQDALAVKIAACQAGIPAAEGRRRLSVAYTLAPRMKTPDVDDPFAKSLLDSLVACGLLVNDSPKWCEYVPPTYTRGKAKATVFTLEDLE